jgi:hypothetical protein
MTRTPKARDGHLCRICGRRLANERFSGKGHVEHVCRDCADLPKDERQRIEAEDEIRGFLAQSHISQKNLRRLASLAGSADPETARLAALVAEIARVTPYRRRRFKRLCREHRPLFLALAASGLVPCWDDLDDPSPDEALDPRYGDRLEPEDWVRFFEASAPEDDPEYGQSDPEPWGQSSSPDLEAFLDGEWEP